MAGMEDLKLTSKGGRPLTLTPEQVLHADRRFLDTGCEAPSLLVVGILG